MLMVEMLETVVALFLLTLVAVAAEEPVPELVEMVAMAVVLVQHLNLYPV